MGKTEPYTFYLRQLIAFIFLVMVELDAIESALGSGRFGSPTSSVPALSRPLTSVGTATGVSTTAAMEKTFPSSVHQKVCIVSK